MSRAIESRVIEGCVGDKDWKIWSGPSKIENDYIENDRLEERFPERRFRYAGGVLEQRSGPWEWIPLPLALQFLALQEAARMMQKPLDDFRLRPYNDHPPTGTIHPRTAPAARPPIPEMAPNQGCYLTNDGQVVIFDRDIDTEALKKRLAAAESRASLLGDAMAQAERTINSQKRRIGELDDERDRLAIALRAHVRRTQSLRGRK